MPINEDHRYRWPCIKHTAFLQCRDYYIRVTRPRVLFVFTSNRTGGAHSSSNIKFRNFHLIFQSSKIED